MKTNSKKISIILPCRNEEKSLGFCLQEIKKVINDHKLNAEIIVSDSSIDKSPDIAKSANVILLKHDQEGYGRAYLEAFKIAQGQYLFLADADKTYEFTEMPNFIKYLDNGYEFVIGNRFGGKIENGAMPWLHRYGGRPIFSFLFKLFFNLKIKDIHCGMRAINIKSLDQLNLKTTGMEFASEMIIMAVRKNLKIKELPINYRRRLGESKLKSFSDGWRHLRFLLLYSPLYLLLTPGLVLFLFGTIMTILLFFNKIKIFGLQLYYHPLFISSLAIIVGYQLIFFAFFTKIFAINHLGEKNHLTEWLFKYIKIEKAGITGLLLIFIGSLFFTFIFYQWLKDGFPELDAIKLSIVAFIFIIMGCQAVSASFIMSIISIKEK